MFYLLGWNYPKFSIRRTFNGDTQEGIGQHQATQKDGRRWSASKAYLHPAMKRPNLHIHTDAAVKRVLT